ncbi:MAG: hypothetical protein K5893_09875 [Prevotella sp.]|nr:hypothetical protein [Prevotella sp.]
MKKRLMENLGWLLIIAGILLFVISFLAGWTEVNWVQFIAFALVLAGAWWRVYSVKKRGKY